MAEAKDVGVVVAKDRELAQEEWVAPWLLALKATVFAQIVGIRLNTWPENHVTASNAPNAALK